MKPANNFHKFLDTSQIKGVNSASQYEKSKERSALLMFNTIFYTFPEAVGILPSRSAPADRR
ncbi:MAG TPA: hypothetical protein PLD33_04585 [Anaerolineales bacterium]|nr:hypothetical protein [Anaerolineales bacterium]HMV96448.1 hypothetical protein [Anaerolineales bacterium]HMX18392.1 hypothetical protein [Anaerolineales bacterium]HMZ41571.1 hypothetical protein [Anaerolineales bacterium]HNA53872.1 hypothetical protein [Anaerolineales bacterium]